MTGNSSHFFLNHIQTLPRSGIYYYTVKIVKTASKIIFLGYGGRDLKPKVNSHTNQIFVGLYLANSNVYANGTNIATNFPLQIVDNDTVFKVVANLN